MMAYCTQADLETRYGTALLVQLSDRAEVPTGAIDADLVARAIADASALIDGYLAGRYALPLTETPALVQDIAQRVAIYYAHGETVSDKIRADHEAALRQMREIAGGTITLDAGGNEPEASGGGEVITNAPERPFTPASLKGFI